MGAVILDQSLGTPAVDAAVGPGDAGLVSLQSHSPDTLGNGDAKN